MRLPIPVLATLVALAPLSSVIIAQAQVAPGADSTPPQPGEQPVRTEKDRPPVKKPEPPPPPPPEKAPPPEEPPGDEAPPVDSAPPVDEGGEGAVEGDGEDPARPPAKGKGAVWGVVTDTKLKEPVIEGQVTVLGTKYKTLTDIDGRYRLELPPGTYNLRVYYELHTPVRIDGVKVVAGKVVQFDAQLTPEENAIEVMEVETEADRAALEGQILSRQRSASVGDGIGRAEISKTPDSNAAQAAQRVVGANIVGGRFVYVRGLGERYSNATLNGAPLPSPEPDRAAVPLDLFPAQAIDGITISKTFAPHMPADFAGGSLSIETRKIPTEFLFNTSLSLGFNTQTTFRELASHRGSGTDFLGFDSGTRAKPDGLPDFKLVRSAAKPDGTFPTDEEIQQWGKAANSYMSSERQTAPMNHGLAVVAGNGWRLGREQRMGVLAAVTYSRSFEGFDDGLFRDFNIGSNDQLKTKNEFTRIEGQDLVRWGALGSVSFEPHPDHRFTLLGFHSQLADKITSIQEGLIVDNENPRVHATRLSFISRSLDLLQLNGEHKLPDLDNAILAWNGSYGIAKRDEPDTRDTVYSFRSDLAPQPPRWTYVGFDTNSGRHFWSEQKERSMSAGLNYTQPLAETESGTKLLLGGLVSVKSRDFNARRFNYTLADLTSSLAFCEGEAFPRECPDKLFIGDNIGVAGPLVFQETTQDTDAYEATLDVLAAYVEADVAITPDLRVILGERFERTVQTVDPVNQFNATNFNVKSANLRSSDLLPSIGLVYSATQKAKMRAAFTRTLARPQVRELAPFLYTDYFNARENGGNPDLQLTRIWNADLRFEYFPTLKEVAAFSIFYKNFQDPIEPVVIPAGSNLSGTFRNTPGANLIGLELETRKTLEFIAPDLKFFTAIFNLTLADSRIQVQEAGAGESFMTNISRPLVQQAPYVLNVALDYTNDTGTGLRLLYNVVGPRIVDVGTDGLEDVYEQPRHLLDLAASQDFLDHFQVKLTLRNLLNAPVRWTQGKENVDEALVRRYTWGTIASAALSYSY